MAKVRTFEKLSRTKLCVGDPAFDLRGQQVRDSGGRLLGEVDELIVDVERRRVRFLSVGQGGGFLGLGRRRKLVSVDAIYDVAEGLVHVSQTRDPVGAFYIPDLITEAEFRRRQREQAEAAERAARLNFLALDLNADPIPGGKA